MKRNIIVPMIILFGVMMLSNCTKTIVDSPDNFDVTTSKATYKVGDTVKFILAGSPDQVIFYSGEIGMRYVNAERTTGAGIAKLVFQTSLQKGVLTNGDSLRLLVSSNLKGYDSISIVKASWTDITSRNTKWPTAITTSYTTSDSINLTDFNVNDSINIAFRYKGKKSDLVTQQKWLMQGFSLVNILPDGTKTGLFAPPQIAAGTAASAFANTGWVEASLKNNTLPGFNAWNVGVANTSAAKAVKNPNGINIVTAYPITFDPGLTTGNDDNDDWLITTKVNLKQVKPDFGVPIKNAVALTLTKFNAVPATYYKTPGTYTATFVALNLDITKVKKVVKTVTFTVTP
ncbi:MAG: DUF5017 domain-containing protein [Prolixibacteraceae bacterium]|jgi:Domain of unknown function (DUF5017)